jgi:hypothetical protein
MGIVIGIFNLSAGLTALVIKRTVSRFANINMLLIILLLDAFYLLALIPVSSILSVVLVSIIGQFARGSRTPITQCIMQDNLTSTERATFTSVLSLVGSLLYIVVNSFISVFNLSRSESLLVGLFGVIIILGLFLRSKFVDLRVKNTEVEITVV